MSAAAPEAGVNPMRAAPFPRFVLALALAIQAAFAILNLWAPGWRPVDLDREHNLPTWFHSGLLAAVAVLALDVLRREVRLLREAGRGRWWAAAWLVVAGGFAYLGVDESLVIHEGFYTAELRAWLTPSSRLQLTLAWLLIFLPAIVATVTFLLASLGARARLCPRLVAWAAAGLGLWIVALTLEGTAKSFFLPRNLYFLEVILEETAESLGTTFFAWGVWQYRAELAVRLAGAAATALPAFAVPWRWVLAGTAALALPVAVVAGSIALNPRVLQRYVGDEHLRAGRLDEAVRAYRAALAAAPNYGRAWYRLGVAELRRGEFQAAEGAFAAVERLEPRNARAANHRGVALFRQERHLEAAEAFARAVELAPSDADAHRNLGIALRGLGREAEAAAALDRARALRPERLRVTSVRVSLPADVALAYVVDQRLETALGHTRAGRLDAAAAEYRRVLATTPDLAAAHVGLANELLRWRVAERLVRGHAPEQRPGARIEPVQPAVLFTDWVQHPDGRWESIEVTVEPRALPGGAATLGRDAGEHYQRALALGVGAPAWLGLALLAREDGRPGEAALHLAAARTLEPALRALDSIRLDGPPAGPSSGMSQ